MARTKRTRKAARDHYQEITDRIIAALETGTAPWQKPWKRSPYGSTPHNPVSGTRYRGINVWLTLMTMFERGYEIPMFVTFKQAHEIAAKAYRKAGRKVEEKTVGRRGKKVYVFADGPDKGKSVGGIKPGQNKDNGCGATTVVFWKTGSRTVEDEEGNEEEKSWAMLRAYSVFNIEQCDDIVRDYLCPPVEAPEFTPIEVCERIVEGYEVETRHGGDRAYYSPSEDRIQLPPRHRFDTPEAYYSVRFHEMGHSTGHASRLGRESIKVANLFGSHEYAEEELVAEFTACFLAGEAGIERVVSENSAAYLRHWASKLREDKKLVVLAAQRAQKAADLILGRQPAGKTGEAENASEAA